MIWDYNKVFENEAVIKYNFKWEDDESVSGIIAYDKKSKEIIIENNNKMSFQWVKTNFQFVIDEGFPDKRTVMIG